MLGRRENGYHDVRMVMQSIYLYDEVKIAKKKEPGITLTTNLKFLPTGDGNIAYKAQQALMDEFDLKEGVQITLNKHIPVAAGLAGKLECSCGSVWNEPALPDCVLTQQELMDRGVKLGADVPCVLCAELFWRRNRRRIKCPSCHAEMYGTDRQASDQCFDEDGV